MCLCKIIKQITGYNNNTLEFMNVDIYCDYEDNPNIRRMEEISRYLKSNNEDISVIYILIVNQSDSSLNIWESFFKTHPNADMIRFIRDELRFDDGYITCMYKLAGIPTGEDKFKINVRLIMFDEDLPNRLEHFQEIYKKVKKQLNSHSLNIFIIHVNAYSNIRCCC